MGAFTGISAGCLLGAPSASAERLQARPIEAPIPFEVAGSIRQKAIFVRGRLKPNPNRGTEGRYLAETPSLWVTNGTRKGTKPVLEFSSKGAEVLSYEIPPLNVSGHLVFAADDGVHGVEWWSSDGTVAGTRMLIDAMPGPASSVSPSDLPPVRLSEGTAVIPIRDPEHGREWWRSDGTPEGTEIIADLHPGPGDSYLAFSQQDRLVAGGVMFFTAITAPGQDQAELWRTDGTPEGTFPLGLSMGAGELRGGAVGNELLFGSSGGYGLIPEMWRSDGTPEGTVPYYDFPQHPMADPVAFGFSETEGKLFLNRRNALWVIDDAEMPPRFLRSFEAEGGLPINAGNGNRSGFGAPVGSALLFAATLHDAEHFGNHVPWVSLGTPETTVPLDTLIPGPIGGVDTTGERALVTQRRDGGPVLLSTTGSGESVRRIRVPKGVDSLKVSEPTEAAGRVYFAGRSVKEGRRSIALWSVKPRR